MELMLKEKLKNISKKLLKGIKKYKILIAVIILLGCGCCYRDYNLRKKNNFKNATSGEKTSKTILINSNLYGKSMDEKKNYLLTNFTMDNTVIANENAPITIIDFSSYTCEFCKKMRKDINKIIEKYVIQKKVANYVLRPVYGTKTIPFGAFLLCSVKEKRKEIAESFFNFDLNKNMEQFLIDTGKKYNLAEDYVKQCIHSEENYEKIIYMQNENRKVFDLTRTPLLVINGKEYLGYKNYEEIKHIMDNIVRNVK